MELLALLNAHLMHDKKNVFRYSSVGFNASGSCIGSGARLRVHHLKVFTYEINQIQKPPQLKCLILVFFVSERETLIEMKANILCAIDSFLLINPLFCQNDHSPEIWSHIIGGKNDFRKMAATSC